jgi:hypothetical protein
VDSVNSLTQLRKETLWQQIGRMVDARRMGSGGHGADVRASETTLTDGTWRALGLGLLRAARSLACGSIFGSFLPVRRDGICAALLSRRCHRSFGSINFGDAADHLCGSELQHQSIPPAPFKRRLATAPDRLLGKKLCWATQWQNSPHNSPSSLLCFCQHMVLSGIHPIL